MAFITVLCPEYINHKLFLANTINDYLYSVIFLQLEQKKLIQTLARKSNLHYTRGITLKRATSGGAHFRSLAPGQHCSEETSQQWRGVGDTVTDLTSPGMEPETFCTDSDVFHNRADRPELNISIAF